MNLIICCTPLQMLIAEAIIRQSNEKYILLVLSLSKSNKYTYYLNNLRKHTIDSYFFEISQKNKILQLINFIKFRYFFISEILNKDVKIKSVYIASIDSVYLHSALSLLKYRNSCLCIYTFDDGTANIDENSQFYIENRSKYGKIFYFLLGNRYNLSIVKKKSSLHYTIYKNMKNIIYNTEYIDIVHFYQNKNDATSEKNQISPPKCVSILLGQPLSPMTKKDYIHLIEKIHNNFNIDFYFPHPREEYSINIIDNINCDFIFEEYIISELKKNNYIYHIFTFFSSAALNINNLSERISIFSIYSNLIPTTYNNAYNIFKKQNVQIITID